MPKIGQRRGFEVPQAEGGHEFIANHPRGYPSGEQQDLTCGLE
jgi:hypothetical protein